MNIFEKMNDIIENKKASYNEIMHGIKILYKLELITDTEREQLQNTLWSKVRG